MFDFEAGVRVLCVDADPDAAATLAADLEARRADLVVEAAGGREATIERVGEGDVDAVVTDHDPPALDGVELVGAVVDERPHLPVVPYVADGSEAVATRALAAGAVDYLPRALDVGKLADRVTAAVERHRTCERRRTLLESIFDNVPVHLYVKDEQARHVRVSSAFVDDPSAFLGKTDLELTDFVSEEHARRAYEDDMQVIESGEPILDKEEYLPSRNQWNLTSKVPWRDADGNVVGLVGISWDITDRKRSKQRLQRQNERLEGFASVVSHDLRNPMQIAQMYLDLAREEPDAGHLDVVDDELDRMDELVSDVLALARGGRTVVDPSPVDLAAVVDDAWTTVDAADATLECPADLGRVTCEEGRLRRLLENLLVNAVEHAGPDVTVAVGRLDDDREGFYVADDGPGIEEADPEKLFDPGYSGDDGTGFGLAIVDRIARAHDWTVEVTDDERGGARFEVTGVESD